MDARLKYKEHIARAASKGLEAALELKRLKGLSPPTARQLFVSTVVPVVDYASNVWMHAVKNRVAGPINRVQKIGAQAIVGTFLTVATSVAEAEASITSVQDRFWRRAIKLWTDIHTLPATNPLRSATSRIRKFRRYHRSPFYQVADVLKDIPMESLETINPFTLAPWEERIQSPPGDTAAGHTNADCAVHIAVSSSVRNDVVGIGGVIQIQRSAREDPEVETFSSTISTRSEQNPHSGELAALAIAFSLLPNLKHHCVILLSNNKAAIGTLTQPRQQSGQENVRGIYDSITALQRDGNTVIAQWLPRSEENKLLKLAKEKAKGATQPGAIPQLQLPMVRSTILSTARSKRQTMEHLPENVGKHSKEVDTALPGKHTRQLYDQGSWKEASVLAQLRTGMARLNVSLYRIDAVPSDQCACGQARETVEHFLFRCKKWIAYRAEMLQCTDTHRSNISFYLGGKSPSDDESWTPNMKAVRATIRFALATGRLDEDQPRD
jgi:ribonuclease HI